ncbi:acyl-CoA thioesterase [Saccharibacillus sp. O16]|nr:acyl-CoA thioesterase [Saccharibacillus sp. O16]
MDHSTRSAAETQDTINEEGRQAPHAPRDPVERRSFCYVLFDVQAEATVRPTGQPSQEIYLDNGRLAENVRWTSGVEDEAILQLLGTCEGFRQLVHSMGVTVESADPSVRSVTFLLQHWGKQSRYETGTTLRVNCPADGAETIIELGSVAWSQDDDIPGKMAFESEQPGDLAKVTVALYLNDGYSVPEPQMDSPVSFESETYLAMIVRSQLRSDHTGRLRAAIQRAQSGEAVTVAYIGGSITQGAGAKPIHTECYAHLSYQDFVTRFGQATAQDEEPSIRFIKAGVGGTPSELGMIRYDRDVRRDGEVLPDIVVVEYAVNDADDETEGECYESLCRKILSAPNRPAVILLFSVFMNDWNLQDRLLPIAERYGLPAVSIKDAVVPQFGRARDQGGVISKRQFFYDIYHPTNDGHRIMADCLGELFRLEAAKMTNEEDSYRQNTDALLHGNRSSSAFELPNPVYGAAFESVRLLDRKDHFAGAEIDPGDFTAVDADLHFVELDDQPLGTPQLPHNWMHVPTAEGDHRPFRLKIRSRNLLLIFKDSGSPEFGRAEVYVDGRLHKVADPHLNNWTHCNTVILFQEQAAAEHEIEIRMASGDEQLTFTVLGFGYTE